MVVPQGPWIQGFLAGSIALSRDWAVPATCTVLQAFRLIFLVAQENTLREPFPVRVGPQELVKTYSSFTLARLPSRQSH
jgi:hypothetical protein